MIGCAIVAACQVARASDPKVALFGATAVCALIAYLLEGWFDQGISSFRIAILVGCLVGATEAARHALRQQKLGAAR